MIIDCTGLERAVDQARDLLKREHVFPIIGRYVCASDEAFRLAADMVDEQGIVLIARKPGCYRVLGCMDYEGTQSSAPDYSSTSLR